jgi:hypothetical protein
LQNFGSAFGIASFDIYRRALDNSYDKIPPISTDAPNALQIQKTCKDAVNILKKHQKRIDFNIYHIVILQYMAAMP